MLTQSRPPIEVALHPPCSAALLREPPMRHRRCAHQPMHYYHTLSRPRDQARSSTLSKALLQPALCPAFLCCAYTGPRQVSGICLATVRPSSGGCTSNSSAEPPLSSLRMLAVPLPGSGPLHSLLFAACMLTLAKPFSRNSRQTHSWTALKHQQRREAAEEIIIMRVKICHV